jgi:ATP-dependent exoDNAse (exonuclease V) alpha subunit
MSQRQLAQIHTMANKADAKVVYLGDALQLQAVEAGKPFELAQRHGMETAHMTEISCQKTPQMKAVVAAMVGSDRVEPGQRLTDASLNGNAPAFEAMDRAGMVREVPGKADAVLNTLVQDVMAMPKNERERTLVITAFNRDRKAINEGIRDLMRSRHELQGSDHQQVVYESKGWTRAMIKEAQYYEAGDVVRFGRDYKTIDASKGQYSQVVAVDAYQGLVTLERDDGSRIAWHPHRHNNVEVYNVEPRAIAAGDNIRITRNEADKTAGTAATRLKNGEVAHVETLNGNMATIRVGEGNQAVRRELDLGAHPNRHWDHAYASTVHASQGRTEYRAVLHIRAAEAESERKQQRALHDMAKVFGERSFYVSATRATHELSIYTNSKDLAAAVVTGKQDKTSAVETLQRASVHPPPARSPGEFAR